MNDDTRQPESETSEPVFQSDDQESNDSNAEPNSDGAPNKAIASEPSFASDTESDSTGDVELPAPAPAEPVFLAGGEAAALQESEYLQEVPEASDKSDEWEFPTAEAATVEEMAGDTFENSFQEQDYDDQPTEAGDANWVNIAPNTESEQEPRLETEYSFFDDTPAAQVATTPPPTRKLGRTGPVWVLGGIALVLIAGLVWLGISRLTGSEESSAVAPSEPSVQQVAAEEPTPAPPTNTPGPAPTPTPILLPVNANVVVGDTEGQGVKVRAEPGLDGELVDIIPEGTTVVVLAADPDSQHAEYPVPADGYLWYRMRVTGMEDTSENPLIGWSASEFFVVDNQ